MMDKWAATLVRGEQEGYRYQWRVLRRAPAGQSDRHLASAAGSSLEFREHREYQAGDDLRYLDWSASARSERLLVKVFEQELHPHLELILDASRSMDLEGSEKARASLGLAALLAASAIASGFSCRAVQLRESCQPLGCMADRPSEWSFDGFAGRVSGGQALLREGPRWRPRSVRVLLSDLFWPEDPIPILTQLSWQAALVVVAQVVAQADLNPTFRGQVRLVDVETGQQRDLLVNDGVLQRYRDAWTHHQEQWQRACRQVGAAYVQIIAEEFVRDWIPRPLLVQEILQMSRA
ncbi:MAG: DUF58 domain-containing protein [Gemmatales bacterium]|nr:DUF58 domain-containing protein [Gemmatales bacterium]MCS7161213.1 DUF58 domain-containing protein [Gemmatales bacterium]MDW8176416.1 DUF58 domain-containing protein [Gemmatales bacterium]MDW8222779.1 DUF58 domain-containing protein [Gemmatales bacterium]